MSVYSAPVLLVGPSAPRPSWRPPLRPMEESGVRGGGGGDDDYDYDDHDMAMRPPPSPPQGGERGGRVLGGSDLDLDREGREKTARRDRLIRAAIGMACLVAGTLAALFGGRGRLGGAAARLLHRTAPAMEDGGAGAAAASVPAARGNLPDFAATDAPPLPPYMEGYAGVAEPRSGQEIAVFWRIPQAGGGIVKAVLGRCLFLVEASDLAGRMSADSSLTIYETTRGTRFVNVDTTTIPGIERGKYLGLASSGIVDVVYTPHLHRAASMFPPPNRGRVFAVFRHPVERAASSFFRERRRSRSGSDLTLAQYARSAGAGAEDNHMTRRLSNKYDGPLTEGDLHHALEVMRRKVLVGLADQLEESLGRFRRYFGWDRMVPSSYAQCQQELLSQEGGENPAVQEGSEGWDLLVEQNRYDLKVYEYAQYLYNIQGQRL